VNPTDIILAILLTLAVCGGVWFGFHVLIQNGRILVRLEKLEERLAQQNILQEVGKAGSLGFPPGHLLNNFALPMLGGGTMALSELRGRKVALIYLSPSCTHCEKLLPDLAAALAEGTDADPAVLIVSTGSPEENRRFFGEYRLSCPILLQEDSEVQSVHRAMATPMAYLLDENGTTSGQAAVGPAAVLNLLRGDGPVAEAPAEDHSSLPAKRTLASSRINRDGLKAGTRAPEFTIPALDGTEISLNSFRGRPVLLVFSDPECTPCNELLPKLEKLHRKSEDLQVLIISRGDPEVNRKKMKSLGLTFPVVLQRSWEISRAYGMFATPIAYLVGEDGVLAEDVKVGGNGILALAARQRNASVRVGP
jgi:peroxiredoxin